LGRQGCRSPGLQLPLLGPESRTSCALILSAVHPLNPQSVSSNPQTCRDPASTVNKGYRARGTRRPQGEIPTGPANLERKVVGFASGTRPKTAPPGAARIKGSVGLGNRSSRRGNLEQAQWTKNKVVDRSDNRSREKASTAARMRNAPQEELRWRFANPDPGFIREI